MSKVFRTPDRKSGREPVRVTAGAPGSFGFPGSPERFIFLSYWRRLSYSTKDIEIESNAWDEIDGNKVLLLTVNEFPHSHLPEKKWSKYWIDLKRGGNVVKYEFYAGPNLRYRDYNILIRSVELPNGQRIWFPVHGEHESFYLRRHYSTVPVCHETYDVVRGSLVLNNGLTDERFSVRWDGHRPVTTGLKEARREFEAVPPKPAPPQLRTDPAGVEEDLKRRLAEADRQARQLDASPPSRRGWDMGIIAQSTLASLGVGTLIVAFLLRRRAS